MSLRQLRRRVEKVAAQVDPDDDGGFTFEELCRAYWRSDKRAFLKLVTQDSMLGLFIPQFQREDAEALRTAEATKRGLRFY